MRNWSPGMDIDTGAITRTDTDTAMNTNTDNVIDADTTMP